MKYKLKYPLMATLIICLLSDIKCMEKEHSNEMLKVINQHTQEISQLKENLKTIIDDLHKLTDFTNNIAPIGAIMEYSGIAVPPNNWLECNGQPISRVDYAELVKVIGVAYGSGDALNTFNVPDRRGRVAVGIGSDSSTNGLISKATAPSIVLGETFGKETHTLTTQELAAHQHSTSFYNGGGSHENVPLFEAKGHNGTSKLSDLSGGDQPHNNVQPSIFVKFYIRAK